MSAGDRLRIAALKGISAGSCNLLLAWLLGQAQWLDVQTVAKAAMVGTLGYGVSLAAFVSALRHLGTARTGAYFSLAPFVGATLSLVLFHEPVSSRFLAAALCMGVGIYLHLTEHHEHEHTHEELEHEHVHDEHHQHDHESGQSSEEPHTHSHSHTRLSHKHSHYPDIHHRHDH